MKRTITIVMAVFVSLGILVMPVYADTINESRAKEQAYTIARKFQGKEYIGTFSISMEDGVRIELKKIWIIPIYLGLSI